MTIRILLADDHPLVRRGLRALLEAEPDFQVVGEAADGLEAQGMVARLVPDVLVIDLVMPGLNGLEVIRQLAELNLPTRAVVLSMHSDDVYVLKALQHGALGYVLKDADEHDLVTAVHQAVVGKRFLSAPIADRLLEVLVNRVASGQGWEVVDSLTDREREVLQLAAQGRPSAEIAARLHISLRTAATHRANLMRKLNLHNQTELVRYALEKKILVQGS